MLRIIVIFAFFVSSVYLTNTFNKDNVPPYVTQCYKGDPKVISCFKGALRHIQPYLAAGIPEIELPSVEPFRMGELSLSLTTGPNGYKISLLDIDIFGASNFTVTHMKLSENNKPFEAKIRIPQLRINSRYQSSGVLIIVPASGNGTLNGRFDDVLASLKGFVSINKKEGLEYLHVDSLHVDIVVKKVWMAVKNIYKNNRILTEAINLFLRDNGQEVLKAMTPQLGKKLSGVFMGISNQLLTHLPIETFYAPPKEIST